MHMFSIWGYLSVALWLAVPVLWVLHEKRRPRRWLCHWALVVAVLAYAPAKINSVAYVNRIELDQSAEIAAAQAKQEAARKAAQQARGDEAARVSFAEDSAHDRMDAGGMDSADLKYMEKISAPAEPEWKREKKQRTGGAEPDDSIEAAVEGTPVVAAAEAPGADLQKRAPVMMVEKARAMANRLDALNLSTIRLLVLLGIGIVIADYLRRVNIYEEAYLPLPLPAAVAGCLTPAPALVKRRNPPRRSMGEELAWIARRGDVFVHLTGDPSAAAAVPERLARLPRGGWPMEVVRDDADDTFVFEALWYSRASFVIASAARAEAFLASAAGLLRRRAEARSKVRQTVHVVWDVGRPLPAGLLAELEPMARATGWTVVESSTVESNRQQSPAIDARSMA